MSGSHGPRLQVPRAWSVALLPPAAFAVHQLRFVLAYGDQAGAELRGTGHSYLHSVVPWLVLLSALWVGGLLRLLARGAERHREQPRAPLSLPRLWLACAVALLLMFAGQELLEGVFVARGPAGLARLFSYGWWCALPVAAAIGLALAAVYRGSRWLVQEVARRRTRTPARIRRQSPTAGGSQLPRPRPAPLLAGWSSRGPPS